MVLPQELLSSGGKYQIEIRDGDIYVVGNTNGLLYLAEVLIRCAKGKLVESTHVHLPLDSVHETLTTDIQPELVVFAATEERL
jgi:hypothetical protein